jgi:hypothetical protein
VVVRASGDVDDHDFTLSQRGQGRETRAGRCGQ